MATTKDVRKALMKMVGESILGERQDKYGSPEDSFRTIAQYWTQYLGIRVSPRMVAEMMVLFKVARMEGHFHLDNYIDAAGYALLAAEIGGYENAPKGISNENSSNDDLQR